MFFRNLYSSKYDTKVLSSLGLNVIGMSRYEGKEGTIISMYNTIESIRKMRDGLSRGKFESCYDIVDSRVLKHQTLLRGIIKPSYGNYYPPEKIYKHLSRNDIKKAVLLQRMDMILLYLTTAGRLNDLRSA